MKTYVMLILLGLCLVGIPGTSFAALEWRIEWDASVSPQTATVWIFNPEPTFQSFTLEIGDVARTSDDDPQAPYLIIGQNVAAFNIAPSERRKIPIVVYLDIDPQQTTQAFSNPSSVKVSALETEQHRQQLRILVQRYGASNSRDYPVVQGVVPVPRDGSGRVIYKSKRGYWITSLIDHDHIAEQLIRTGDGMEASYNSIQQAIFYYTQGNVALSGEAADVWANAFPELTTEISPTPYPYGDCTNFVTVVTSNLSYSTAGRMISVGDVLAPANSSYAQVVAAEDVNYNLSPNTTSAKQVLRVYLMSQRGRPTEQTQYVRIVNHNTQIEQAIRVGTAEQYHPCAIQDVIFYMNNEVASLNLGQRLWARLGGGTGSYTPVPTYPPKTTSGICVGNPTTQPTGRTAGMAFKNLTVLTGAVVPFSLIVRRKRRK